VVVASALLEWGSAKTMARLLDMGESTFRARVAIGALPKGKKDSGLRRWHVSTTLAPYAGRASTDDMVVPPVAVNDNDEAIMAGIIAYAAQAQARRRTPRARAPRAR
jgi:hypothetical protein